MDLVASDFLRISNDYQPINTKLLICPSNTVSFNLYGWKIVIQLLFIWGESGNNPYVHKADSERSELSNKLVALRWALSLFEVLDSLIVCLDFSSTVHSNSEDTAIVNWTWALETQ